MLEGWNYEKLRMPLNASDIAVVRGVRSLLIPEHRHHHMYRKARKNLYHVFLTEHWKAQQEIMSLVLMREERRFFKRVCRQGPPTLR